MASVKCGFNDVPGAATGRALLIVHGPTIAVDIGFDQSYQPNLIPHKTPVPNIRGVLALVDTGATECCVDDSLAQQLKLPVVNRVKIGGVGGLHEVNMYLAQVHIPSLNYTMYGAFAGVNLVSQLKHMALVGRTFLSAFILTYNGVTGTVEIAHATPRPVPLPPPLPTGRG